MPGIVHKIRVSAEPAAVVCGCWIVLRYILAGIILTAACLKAHQLAVIPSSGEGLLHARWFNIFAVEFELFFGIWLLFGLLPKLTHFAAISLFSLFAAVSFYKAVSGEASCGCFGELKVNPWFTMSGDLIAVSSLIFVRPANVLLKSNFELFRFIRQGTIFPILGLWLIFGTGAWIWISGYSETSLTADGLLVSDAGVISFKPEEWIEKNCR